MIPEPDRGGGETFRLFYQFVILFGTLDKSEFVDLSVRGMPICDGERALPGRGTAFLEKPWEKHQGRCPWTPSRIP